MRGRGLADVMGQQVSKTASQQKLSPGKPKGWAVQKIPVDKYCKSQYRLLQIAIG
jgi:hypothetical protein